MAFTDPSNQDSSIEALEGPVENQPTNTLPSSDASAPPSDVQEESDAEGRRRQILIGSQRDPAAYRARQRRDWKPIDEPHAEKPSKGQRNPESDARQPEPEGLGASVPSQIGSGQSAVGSAPAPVVIPPPIVGDAEPPAPKFKTSMPASPGSRASGRFRASASDLISELAAALGKNDAPPPRPSVRDKLSPELEDELDLAMGSDSMDDLLGDFALILSSSMLNWSRIAFSFAI